jgi:hypothetical protein
MACNKHIQEIEKVAEWWSKVKIPCGAWGARTRDSLLGAIGQTLVGITAQNALNWFAHCGYTFT